jgi:hypothetical protein
MGESIKSTAAILYVIRDLRMLFGTVFAMMVVTMAVDILIDGRNQEFKQGTRVGLWLSERGLEDVPSVICRFR